jgi:hypothetical protein
MMKWERQTGPYQTGEDLVLGKIAVASAYYNGLRSRDDNKAYKAVCTLPGMERFNNVQYLTLEKAKEAAETRVRTWLSGAGLSPTT